MVFQGDERVQPGEARRGPGVEAILLHESVSEGEARRRMEELFEHVGIAPRRANDYPHEFSGGMRQRVMIAMALSCNPPLVIADEPTTALDVMIQAQILNLLARLREERNIALVVITHDLSTLAQVTDRLSIMYAGRIVEEGSASELLTTPRHPYTRALVAPSPWSEPRLPARPRRPARRPASPAPRPPGCAFHPRCPPLRALRPLTRPGAARLAPRRLPPRRQGRGGSMKGTEDARRPPARWGCRTWRSASPCGASSAVRRAGYGPSTASRSTSSRRGLLYHG